MGDVLSGALGKVHSAQLDCAQYKMPKKSRRADSRAGRVDQFWVCRLTPLSVLTVMRVICMMMKFDIEAGRAA
jgi:hypothetical protein